MISEAFKIFGLLAFIAFMAYGIGYLIGKYFIDED